jgi:pimeloyl-[acyl-carrier protein] methyl ester esterase
VSENAAEGKLLKGAVIASLGLLSVPVAVRRLDHARERSGGRDLPCLPDGKKMEGIRSRDGTPLYVDYCGSAGPTVFFVHGWTCSGAIFRYQKPCFSDRYRVVTLDLRGHGRSGMPDSMDFHADRLAEDLKAVVDAFGPEEFVIAGHSMGGFTAFKFHEHFGEEYRGRLKGLVIIDSTGIDLVEGMVMGRLVDLIYPWPLESLLKLGGRESRFSKAFMALFRNSSAAYLLVRWAAFGKNPPADEVEFQRELTFSTPVPTTALALKACLDYHVDYHLPNVDVPVLILVGSEDRLTNKRANRRTCELLPDARLVVFEGAGHDTQLERSEELNRELRGFLEECFGR